MNNKILIIDDEQAIVNNLKDYFEDIDFKVLTAANGREGLDCIDKELPDIVIVDLNMPVINGFEFIDQAKKDQPNLPIIVLSGIGFIDGAMKAVRMGAWDFISKPVKDMQVLLHSIEKCQEKARLIDENIKYNSHLEDLVRQRTQQLEKTKYQIIRCLGKASEFKDNETGNHVLRVSQMSYILARGVGLDEGFCRVIRDAAPMHDVGKIGIADKVLLKNGSLDDQEWEHMKKHVIFGCSILSTDDDFSDDNTCSSLSLLDEESNDDILMIAKRIALFHHERWDGKGYPFGLEKENIPLEARIVSLVDVYDAISSKRPYKEAFPEDKCQKIIKEGTGTQFDPDVVKVFFAHIESIIETKQKYLDI